MTASGTKGPMVKTSNAKKSIQLIVFAPINADPEDDDNRIYMVCPSSLKVVEVVEKYDEDAINYLSLLGKKLKKSEVPADKFEETLSEEFDGEIEVAGEVDSVHIPSPEKAEKQLTSIEEELDEDLVTFAGKSLDDIFPDDGEELHTVSDIDMADAISLLDQEEDETDLKELGEFIDSDELPEL